MDSLQPVNAAPPDLRDEMCGTHRKRPAAEEADDDSEASSFMLSNLPPSAGKASALLKDKPDTVKAIAVFVGAAKNAAETQFANARAKIQKLAKGKKADAKAADAGQAAATGANADDRRHATGCTQRCRPSPLRRPAPSRRPPASRSAPPRTLPPPPTSAILGAELCARRPRPSPRR